MATAENGVDVLNLPNGLSDADAWALAQFVKRITWSSIRECAEDDDEARRMRDALVEMQCALSEAGYAPR